MKDSERDILFLIKYLHKYLQKDLDERLKNDGLTANQGRVIFFIYHREMENNYVTQQDIITRFSLSKSTVSELTSRLEAKDLIQKENIDNKTYLKSTEKSRSLIHTFELNKERTNSLLTKGFSEDDIKSLNDKLTKMIKNMKGDDAICGSK